MNDVISSSDVRKNWSEVIDTVVRKKPVFIKRNRDILAFLSLDQLDLLLESFVLNLKVISEDDGSYTGVVEELDLLGNASTVDELLDTLAKDLIEYADEYMEDFELYYHSSNRKVHFPYVYRVLAYELESDKVKSIFNIRIEDHANT